jgi:hypothetical protein
MSAASGKADSRIAPSLIGTHRNALCSSRFQKSTSPVPSQVKIFRRSVLFERKTKIAPLRDHVDSLHAQGRQTVGARRKSAGFVATGTRTLAGTASMSSPLRRAALPPASLCQSRAQREPWRRRSRSESPQPRLRSALLGVAGAAGPARQSLAQRPRRSYRPCRLRLSPGPPSRLASPTEQLLRRQTVSPRDSRDLVAALIALGENLRLLLPRPRTAAADSGKYFQPAHHLPAPA